MNNIIKLILKKLIYREKASSDSYVSFLRKKGISIGDNVRFFSRDIEIDLTKPSLVTIGNNVQFTAGVKVLTHGFDWYVLNGVYGDVLGSAGRVTIGNNVFIGMNSIILKGVTVGDNVIIGAGSIVTKDIPANTIAVGNPAKVINDIDTYYNKRFEAQAIEARELYLSYKERFSKRPPKGYFHEFFWLFENSEDGTFDEEIFNYEMNLGGRHDQILMRYKETKRPFCSYDYFCLWCESQSEFDRIMHN